MNVPPLPLTASDIFAAAHGYKNEGPERCHWCGSACQRNLIHNDPPPTPFLKSKTVLKNPGSPYECIGCWLWHRQRVTVFFLNGSYKDRQCAERHSWLLTEKEIWAIAKEDHTALYDVLLSPPRRFCLSFLDGENVINHLQCISTNDNMEVKADTPLHFTINHIPHSYTVYELEHALRHEPGGKSPGTQALIRLLGSFKLPEVKKNVGSPKKEDMNTNPKNVLKKTVRASGM